MREKTRTGLCSHFFWQFCLPHPLNSWWADAGGWGGWSFYQVSDYCCHWPHSFVQYLGLDFLLARVPRWNKQYRTLWFIWDYDQCYNRILVDMIYGYVTQDRYRTSKHNARFNFSDCAEQPPSGEKHVERWLWCNDCIFLNIWENSGCLLDWLPGCTVELFNHVLGTFYREWTD